MATIDLSADNRAYELVEIIEKQKELIEAGKMMMKAATIVRNAAKAELKEKMNGADKALLNGVSVRFSARHYQERIMPARDMEAIYVKRWLKAQSLEAT